MFLKIQIKHLDMKAILCKVEMHQMRLTADQTMGKNLNVENLSQQ
jgi:hypothetical protein